MGKLSISDLYESPLSRCNWSGDMVSVDGASTSDFGEDDVAEVVAYASTAVDGWDGDVAGVLRLHDGRFVAWESWWAPTGSGFCEDAYGGTAAIYFGTTLDAVRRKGLGHSGRQLLGLLYDDETPPD